MKIIRVDNFDREIIPDKLIATGLSECYAERIVKLLNDSEGNDSPNFYRCVPDDYKLQTFEP